MQQPKTKTSVRQSDFEALLIEISGRFINLPAERIDEAIENVQQLMCDCLGFDMSVLWQWSETDSNMVELTHLFSPPGGPERPMKINGSEAFPWTYQKMLTGETLAFSTDELPDEAACDRATRLRYGAKSSVVIPLMTGGKSFVGILSFDTLEKKRRFSNKIINRLNLVGEIFSNALARKQVEERLRKSEARLALAAESAGAGLWEFDCNTGTFWATDEAREIFGYKRDEPISLETYEKSVHPDDLDFVRRALKDARDNGSRIEAEYRIILQPNLQKWIFSRGCPYLNNHGSVDRILGVSIDISSRKQLEQDLKNRLAEINALKLKLEKENRYLKEKLRGEKGFENIIGHSKSLRLALHAAKQVAPTEATVLLQGETGTGKGLFARAIHRMSDRSENPFVTVNCAALPHYLIESELFGHEKGAFTGAHDRKPGRFEVADGGTLFLDEIGDIPLELQTKLLRVLQDEEFERLGSSKTIKVNVRIIAATSRSLQNEVNAGSFRQELYYRLNVFPIVIPPLREREEDKVLLIHHFISKLSRKMGKYIKHIPKRTIDTLISYSWPGNVREMEHFIERGVILSTDNTFELNDQLTLPSTGHVTDHKIIDLETLEREHIIHVLSQTGWKINGLGGAAKLLGIHPSTLRFRMKKLGIQRPDENASNHKNVTGLL